MRAPHDVSNAGSSRNGHAPTATPYILTVVTTQAPRPLRPPERSVLNLILSAEFPGVEALRVQAATAIAVRECSCGCPSVELEVADTAPAAVGLSGRVLPFEGRVEQPGDELHDDIIVFTDDGKLSYLEYVWHGDEPPAAWPPLADITIAR